MKASSCYIIVKIGDVLFTNVNLPCVSMPNSPGVVLDCLSSILNDTGDVYYSHTIFGGDLNTHTHPQERLQGSGGMGQMRV